ncbi:MAG TPA: hypothetical protein VNU26_15665 [Mycobacteriales bacterium]|nr:hypothetical protein [Mycobacteriales bacterium]
MSRSTLEVRIASRLPDLRLPAVLLQRLDEALGTEQVQLVCGDLRPLGFGAYDGQLCVVTPTRVLLATATRASGPEGAFGLEHWDREVAPLPRFVPVRPRAPEPDAG